MAPNGPTHRRRSRAVRVHATMPKVLTGDNALLPGDVLLSRGDSEISQAIVELDGGRYSHVGLWSGQAVVESTLPVVREASLDECSEHAEYIDVFRSRNQGDGHGVIVDNARDYLGRPYGALDLALSGLLVAVSAWMPNDWAEMATLHGAGALARMLRLLRLVKEQDSDERVTCAELVARAHFDARAPISVRLLGGRTFKGRSFLRALKSLCQRLHANSSTQHRERSLFEPNVLAEGSLAEELRWLASLPDSDPNGTGRPRGRTSEWIEMQRSWHRSMGLVKAQEPSEQRLGGLQTEILIAQELVVGRDWAPGLVTPRQLEASPSLVRVARVFPA